MEKTIAIVGSRDASGWAKEFAHTLSFKLALSGVVIVSGLARGIDSAAHLGALEGGRTVAVLGNGMDYYYPVSNKALYERIEREGALVTEFPMGTKPYKRNFPQRNRIISGLSEAVVVVQAPLRSGALITASCALEQGRDVFCVPARPNDRRSEGTNLLIKEGATPITSAEELLQHLGWDHEEGKHIRLPEDEAIIYNTLSSDAMSAEQLLASTKLDAKRVNVALTRLQLQGLIRKRGQFYKRV
jgi:DNA processing protein